MADNRYLTEAFQSLAELNEDVFDLTAEGTAELNDFVSNEETDNLENIIDPLATSEEDLQDSYVGKVILDCSICQSKIYKDAADVVISAEGDLANIGEECPYCQSADGYKIIGEVAPYSKTEVEVNVENKDGAEVAEINTDPKADEEDETKNEALSEDLEKVELETDTQKIEIEAKPKTEEGEEMIAPVEPETEAEFTQEEPATDEPEYGDFEVDEFDEDQFDGLGESYLKRVYENVAGFKTTSGKVRGNTLILEGVISFKSGKQAKTQFAFEAKSATKTGKVKFLGENKQFAKGKNAFTLTGKLDGSKLIAESLTYNYRAKDAKTGASKKLYGRVKR